MAKGSVRSQVEGSQTRQHRKLDRSLYHFQHSLSTISKFGISIVRYKIQTRSRSRRFPFPNQIVIIRYIFYIIDFQVTWLASWTENIQNQIKYVMLNPSSRLKGEKDMEKYEKARRLKLKIGKMREDYTAGNHHLFSYRRQCFSTRILETQRFPPIVHTGFPKAAKIVNSFRQIIINAFKVLQLEKGFT